MIEKLNEYYDKGLLTKQVHPKLPLLIWNYSVKVQVETEYWDLIDRKEYAEKIKDNKIKRLLFKRLTTYSDRLNDNIWDMLYPEYFNPFSNKTIEDEE